MWLVERAIVKSDNDLDRGVNSMWMGSLGDDEKLEAICKCLQICNSEKKMKRMK